MTIRYLAPLALGAALLGFAGPAEAQRRDEEVGRSGNVRIVRVFEGNRFDRCYGMVPGHQLGARLFWAVGRDYILTVPGVNPPGDKSVRIRTPGGLIQARGRSDGGRTIITLNGPNAAKFMQLRGELVVDVAGTSFPFRMQGTTMEQVFVSVENCASRNSR
jgi:hypothetical protein